jgi:hypothetical protein
MATKTQADYANCFWKSVSASGTVAAGKPSKRGVCRQAQQQPRLIREDGAGPMAADAR